MKRLTNQQVIALLFLFLLNILYGRAQTVEFVLGDTLDYYYYNNLKLFSVDSEYVYALRASLKHPEAIHHIDVYDKENLKLVSKIKIPVPKDSSVSYTMKGIIKDKQKFMLFYSFFDDSTKQSKIAMLDFSPNGELLGKPVVLDSSQGLDSNKAGTFNVFIRSNKNEFYTWGEKEYWTKKNKVDSLVTSIKFFDYDCKLKRQWNYIWKRESAYMLRAAFDSLDNFYRFTVEFKKKSNPVWKIEIYPTDSTTPITYTLAENLKNATVIETVLAYHISTYEDEYGNMNFFCLYGSGNMNSPLATGIYWLQINKVTHRVTKEKFIRFKKFDRDGMDSYFIMGYTTTTEGKTKIIAENRIEVTSSLYGIEVDRELKIGNIFTTTIDSNLEIKGMVFIRKKQRVNKGHLGYTGFHYLASKDNSYFIYNELPENLLKLNDESPKAFTDWRMQKGVLSVIETNDSSIINKKMLFEKKSKNDMEIINVVDGIHAANNEEFAVVEKNNVYRLLKLYIKDN